jgi:hypothetical protein
MGEIAFRKSFGTIDTGKGNFILEILAGSVIPFAVLSPVPWAFRILSQLPGSSFERFLEWCTGLVDERREVGATGHVNINVLRRVIQLLLLS